MVGNMFFDSVFDDVKIDYLAYCETKVSNNMLNMRPYYCFKRIPFRIFFILMYLLENNPMQFVQEKNYFKPKGISYLFFTLVKIYLNIGVLSIFAKSLRILDTEFLPNFCSVTFEILSFGTIKLES